MIDTEEIQMKILEAIMSAMDEMETKDMPPIGIKIEIEEEEPGEGMMEEEEEELPRKRKA